MAIGPIWRVFFHKFSNKWVSKPFVVIALLVVPALSFWAFFLIFSSANPSHSESPDAPSLPLFWSWAAPSVVANTGGSDRPVYPYSVIPGGVSSKTELQNVLRHDAVAAAHYADFQTRFARVIRLVGAREVYVSYRLGDHVYWTRNRITLRAGETLLSDGAHLVRARCGNRLSETSGPSSPSEPLAEAFDLPITPILPGWSPVDVPAPPPVLNDPSQISIALNSPQPGPPDNAGPVIPIFPFPCCGGGRPSPPNSPLLPQPGPGPTPPPVATPEPSSICLLVVGLIALVCLRAVRRF